jgi:hypothetical protein
MRIDALAYMSLMVTKIVNSALVVLIQDAPNADYAQLLAAFSVNK